MEKLFIRKHGYSLPDGLMIEMASSSVYHKKKKVLCGDLYLNGKKIALLSYDRLDKGFNVSTVEGEERKMENINRYLADNKPTPDSLPITQPILFSNMLKVADTIANMKRYKRKRTYYMNSKGEVLFFKAPYEGRYITLIDKKLRDGEVVLNSLVFEQSA